MDQTGALLKPPLTLIIVGLCYLNVYQRLHFDYVKFKAEELLA